MKVYFSSFIGLLFIQNFTRTLSSHGDQSSLYQKCVKKCVNANCTIEKDDIPFTVEAAKLQDKWCRWLRWHCSDECQYDCMWRTVDAFRSNGRDTVKFHGKWPFKRLYGVQEPASMLCSVLNLLAHANMGYKLFTDSRFSMKTTPLLWFWFLFWVVCLNGWIWSAIFHTRDTIFTEIMDYSCALSMVMALFIASVVRVFHPHLKSVVIVLLVTVLYFAEHVRYLDSGTFDYDFNMKVNVCFGVLGGLIFVAWSLVHWYRTGSAYVWRMVMFVALTGASLLLELIDFPPIADTWDAHAFWHLSTAPLPMLFYRFVMDDLAYLQYDKITDKTTLKFA